MITFVFPNSRWYSRCNCNHFQTFFLVNDSGQFHDKCPLLFQEKFGLVKPSTLALVYYKITEKGTRVLKEDRYTQKDLKNISTISIFIHCAKFKNCPNEI